MFYLRIFKKDGKITNLPIGESYDKVFVDSLGVLQKRAAYDVMKYIKNFHMESLTRNYILTPTLCGPLDKEGVCFGGEIERYEIHANGSCIETILPVQDFSSEDEAVEFWVNIERIPTT